MPLLNDTTPESNETFSVSLSNPNGAGLGTSTATVTTVDDDTPSISGQWGALIPWQTVPIHMHLLPTGKVMFWDRHDPNDPTGEAGHPWIWDPSTQIFTMLPHPDYDIFCSGHTFLSDGRLMVTGGHHMADNVGENTASVYDPLANSWTSLPNMNAGRWYPTNTTLASGDILVLAGTMNGFGDVNPLAQVWQTVSGTWRDLTTATFQGNAPAWPDYYPFMFLAPNGKVFNAGSQQTSRYLDTSGSGTWTDVANSSVIYRDYGSSAMYADGKVLIVGGNPRAPDDLNTLPSATAEVIDLNNSTPAWRLISPMSVGRRHLNTTLLPDGQVLVTGGSSLNGHDNPEGKVLYAEMWNPTTEAWTPMAGYTRYRGYHSNALLLPDGRILVAGGGHPNPPSGAEQNAEIYSPPYLFKGARPTIASAPTVVSYAQTFFVETPTAQSITKITLIRLPSVTHAFNQNQRINQLTFSQTSGGLLATAPTSPNLCPPGDYMLFILNGNGVPSVARFIRIDATATSLETIGVYRPSNSTFYLRNSNSIGFADLAIPYGGVGDQPLVGDWDGNGTTTIGVYRPNNSTFYLRNSNSIGFADVTVPYGAVGDIPIAGDWDGNGTTTIGVYRPGNSTFYLRNSNSIGFADLVIPYGAPGDLPITGDRDGNGTTTIGVFRPGNNTFFLRNSNSIGFADLSIPYGAPGDTPVVADWDGNGTTTIGLYRNSNSTFFLRNSNSVGFADLSVPYGGSGDKPIAGKWN